MDVPAHHTYARYRDRFNRWWEARFESRLIVTGVVVCVVATLFAGTAAQVDLTRTVTLFVATSAMLLFFPMARSAINTAWPDDQDEDHRLAWNLGQLVTTGACALPGLAVLLAVVA